MVACGCIAISSGCSAACLAAGTAPHSKHVCRLMAHPASLPPCSMAEVARRLDEVQQSGELQEHEHRHGPAPGAGCCTLM